MVLSPIFTKRKAFIGCLDNVDRAKNSSAGVCSDSLIFSSALSWSVRSFQSLLRSVERRERLWSGAWVASMVLLNRPVHILTDLHMLIIVSGIRVQVRFICPTLLTAA